METPYTNPYPGLRPFQEHETDLFFGRDIQRRELRQRLQRHRFLAIVGTSGSGKSSLVRAGLIPDLKSRSGRQRSWRVAIMKPGNDPVGRLAEALDRSGVLNYAAPTGFKFTETQLRRSAFGLIDLVKEARLRESDQVLLVVDQFEELFRFTEVGGADRSNEAALFVKLLLAASEHPDVPVHVVLTMRSDFLGDCPQFRDLPEAINDGQYLIPRLTRDERRAIIEQPAATQNVRLATPLVNRLLNDMGENPDQLPILQHALMRTFNYWQQARQNGREITLSDYESIGSWQQALSRHANEAYDSLEGDASKRLAQTLFRALTERGPDNREIRRPVTIGDVAAVAGSSVDALKPVIEAFRARGRSFLLPAPPVSLEADTLLDISHESLIRNWDRLKMWVDRETRSATTYRRLSQTARLHAEGNEDVLSDRALQFNLNWRDKEKPNEAWANRYAPGFERAMGFLDASEQERDRQKAEQERLVKEEEERRMKELNRVRLFAGVVSVLLAVALVSVWFAWTKQTGGD